MSVHFCAFSSSPYHLHRRRASNGSDVRSTSSKSSCKVAVISKMFKQPTKFTSVLRYIVTLKMAGILPKHVAEHILDKMYQKIEAQFVVRLDILQMAVISFRFEQEPGSY